MSVCVCVCQWETIWMTTERNGRHRVFVLPRIVSLCVNCSNTSLTQFLNEMRVPRSAVYALFDKTGILADPPLTATHNGPAIFYRHRSGPWCSEIPMRMIRIMIMFASFFMLHSPGNDNRCQFWQMLNSPTD